jgi:hypothetical protein
MPPPFDKSKIISDLYKVKELEWTKSRDSPYNTILIDKDLLYISDDKHIRIFNIIDKACV